MERSIKAVGVLAGLRTSLRTGRSASQGRSLHRRLWVGLLGLSLPAMMLGGCVQVRNQPVTLSLQAQPTGRAGSFTASGTATSLPERTKIIVQAIRPLTPRTGGSRSRMAKNYAILARTQTEVKQGRWSATLNLWQTAGDGFLREAWQLNPEEAMSVDPATDVVFSATTIPVYPTQATERQLNTRDRRPEQGTIGYTDDGAWYLLAKQPLPVALPLGKSGGVKADLNDLERIWGTNTELPRESGAVGQVPPQKLDKPLNDAPLSENARFR